MQSSRHCIFYCTIIASIFYCVQTSTAIRQFYAELNSPNPAGEFANVTKSIASNDIHCAVQCTTRPDCLTFSFSLASSECRMSNEEPGGIDTDAPIVYNSGVRKRAASGSPCKRFAVAAPDGRQFCPIQQRVSNSSFQQTWTAYETGFGDDLNFWIGLQAIHQLSTQSPEGSDLLVQLITWRNVKLHQVYRSFRVQDASTKYTMTIGALDENRSNLLTDRLHSGRMFSTTDRDNDKFGNSCSNVYHGKSGWWFNQCATSNPNGLYAPAEMIDPMWISWKHNGSWTSLKAIRLLV